MLIGIAFLTAVPLSYYLMHHWLSGFYYHVQPSWIVFAAVILLSTVIAWLTGWVQSNKSSNSKSCKEFENGIK